MHCFPELDLDELVNVTCHLYPIWDEQTCVPNSPEKLQARASFLCPPACAHLCTSVLISFVSGTKNKGHGWWIIFLEAPCEVVQEHLFPIHPPMELSHHTIPTQHQKHASRPSLEELTALSISPLRPDSLNYLECQANASLVGPSRGTSFFSLNHVRIH